MITHHDALGERLVHGHAQAPAQLREPDQEQTEPIVGIHLVVGEQAQILEHLVAQVMGLILWCVTNDGVVPATVRDPLTAG